MKGCVHTYEFLTSSPTCTGKAQQCGVSSCIREGHINQPHSQIPIEEFVTDIKLKQDKAFSQADTYIRKAQRICEHKI